MGFIPISTNSRREHYFTSKFYKLIGYNHSGELFWGRQIQLKIEQYGFIHQP